MAKGAAFADIELHLQALAYRDQVLAFNDYEVHLYVNDHSPVPGDDLASYTECTVTGYVPQTVIRSSWNVADTVAHAVLITQTNPRRFFPLGIATATLVYGYFITNKAGQWVWAEAFTIPQTIGVGQWIDVRAKIRFANCPEP